MQILKIKNYDEAVGILLPFVYNDAVIIQLNFMDSLGFLGYKDGKIFHIDIDELAKLSELEIGILDSDEEIKTALGLCDIVVQKLMMTDTVYVNGVEYNNNTLANKRLIEAFRKINTSYTKTLASLL